MKSGGLTIGALDAVHPEGDAAEWEKVVRKLRSGMMPPAGAPRPPRPAVEQFAASIEAGLDRAALAHPNPGRPALHRLNRTEYGNSVRELLDLEIDPAAYLPPDDMSHGFDNMAETLNVSPTLMEGYVRAAGKISRLAVGDPGMSPLVETYHVPATFSQMRRTWNGAPTARAADSWCGTTFRRMGSIASGSRLISRPTLCCSEPTRKESRSKSR